MNLLSWLGDKLSSGGSRASGSQARRDVYIPDSMGRLDQGSWKKSPDPFGRLPGSDGGETGFPGLDGSSEDGISLSRPVGATGDNRPDDVARVENLLGATGHLGLDATEGPTGYFGARTEQAVKNFQKDAGLKVDGKLNPNGETIGELGKIYAFPSAVKPGVETLPQPVTGDGFSIQTALQRYWDPETGEFKKPPRILLAAEMTGGESPSRLGTNPKSTGEAVSAGNFDDVQPPSLLKSPDSNAQPGGNTKNEGPRSGASSKSLSDEAVRELAGGLHQATQSGDGKQLEGARQALDSYPEEDRNRIEEVARNLSSEEGSGNPGDVSIPLAPRPPAPVNPKDLTPEVVFDALRIPSDPEAFARGDWRARQDNVKETLAELRNTDPETFDTLQEDFERDHTSVYRFPQLLVHDLGAMSYLRDNLDADENQIRESAPRHGFNPDYVLLFRDVVTGDIKSRKDVHERIRDLREKVGGPGLNNLRFAMEKIAEYAGDPEEYTREDKIGFLADRTGFMRDAYRAKYGPVVGMARNASGFVGSYSRGRSSRTMLNEQRKINALGRGQRGVKRE